MNTLCDAPQVYDQARPFHNDLDALFLVALLHQSAVLVILAGKTNGFNYEYLLKCLHIFKANIFTKKQGIQFTKIRFPII